MKKEYKEQFIQAGKIAKEVLTFGKALIKKGASYNDVIAKIVLKIKELGAIPAFPPQIAMDNVAAHYLVAPGSDHIFSDELVKLDIGVCYMGAIGDTAVTIDLSGKNEKLITAVVTALERAEKIIEVGLPIRLIGKIIQETISSFGLSPVRNLAGHGLGYYKIHTSPTIPNVDDGSKAVICPGMTFAIEPFATNGKGMIYEVAEPMIFSASAKRISQLPLHKKIADFKGLPFSMHDLISSDCPLAEVKKELSRLMKRGAVFGYGPLLEETGGLVAQAENSILVDDDGSVISTTR